MNHIEYQMAKYRAQHGGGGQPRNYVADQQAKYEGVHARHADPVEGVFDDVFNVVAEKVGGTSVGPYSATVVQLQAELRRLEKGWAPASIYPTGEAKSIFRAVLDIADAGIEEAISLRKQPAIFGFSAAADAITRGTADIESALNRFLSEMNKPTPEVPQGRPLAVASNAGAKMVNLPALRPGALSVIRATVRAYETYNTVREAIPAPALTNKVLGAIMAVHQATQATLAFIGATFGGIANLPAKFRQAAGAVGTIIKVGAIAGIGVLAYWALKPLKGAL